MPTDEETSPWAAPARERRGNDPELTPAVADPRADAAMMLFESYVSRYQAQALELRRARG